MRVLLIYPRFPASFWSFDDTVKLMGRKAMLPPLGLVTVAALLPQEWEFKLVDRNVRDVTEEEWAWADIVMLSAMIVQKSDMHAQIRRAKRHGKPVVVGGPYPTALAHELRDAGADFLVLDEGEITIPPFLAALASGQTGGTFRSNGEKPDVTQTPVPRFDLLDLEAYAEMSVQFSRGCPFMCEFCDIIVLYGRKPRTKSTAQMLAELKRLYDLGWRRSIFVVDDNFIGNKKNVKELLRSLKPWLVSNGYPFSFSTEASVDLAQDQELMDLMRACNFGAVFLGIETPDPESLKLTKKTQNNRDPLEESVMKIATSGIRIMAGFIIGFDNERSGAGRRIVDFVEKNAIPTATFSMLQALPDTALTHRLRREGRLLEGDQGGGGGGGGGGGDLNQTSLMNFIPTRPMAEIAHEYVEGFWELYDPVKYLNRTFRHYMYLKAADFPKKPRHAAKPFDARAFRALLTVFWRQGVIRGTRWTFWKRLYQMYRLNPGGVSSYLSTCSHFEHFSSYRRLVRTEIEDQLARHVEPVARRGAPAVHVQLFTNSGRTRSLPVIRSGSQPAAAGPAGAPLQFPLDGFAAVQ